MADHPFTTEHISGRIQTLLIFFWMLLRSVRGECSQDTHRQRKTEMLSSAVAHVFYPSVKQQPVRMDEPSFLR